MQEREGRQSVSRDGRGEPVGSGRGTASMRRSATAEDSRGRASLHGGQLLGRDVGAGFQEVSFDYIYLHSAGQIVRYDVLLGSRYSQSDVHPWAQPAPGGSGPQLGSWAGSGWMERLPRGCAPALSFWTGWVTPVCILDPAGTRTWALLVSPTFIRSPAGSRGDEVPTTRFSSGVQVLVQIHGGMSIAGSTKRPCANAHARSASARTSSRQARNRIRPG